MAKIIPAAPPISELDALAGMAAEADQGAKAADAPRDETGAVIEAPAGPDYALEAAGAVDMFAAMVCGYAPKASPLWEAETKSRIAATLAPVMEKYQFSFAALPVEFMFAIVAGPVLFQTAKVIAEQRAEKQAPTASTAAPVKTEQSASVPVHPQMGLYQ